jgi:hypothetical protein
MMVENQGERLFRQCVVQQCYSQPRAIKTGHQEKPDFEVITPAGPVICGVKCLTLGCPEVNQIADRIKKAKSQLESSRGQVTVVILVNTGSPDVRLDNDVITEAMFGKFKYGITRNRTTGRIRPEGITYFSGYGTIRHVEHPERPERPGS